MNQNPLRHPETGFGCGNRSGNLGIIEKTSIYGTVFNIIGNGRGYGLSKYGCQADSDGHGIDLRGGGTTKCTGRHDAIPKDFTLEALIDKFYNTDYEG